MNVWSIADDVTYTNLSYYSSDINNRICMKQTKCLLKTHTHALLQQYGIFNWVAIYHIYFNIKHLVFCGMLIAESIV